MYAPRLPEKYLVPIRSVSIFDGFTVVVLAVFADPFTYNVLLLFDVKTPAACIQVFDNPIILLIDPDCPNVDPIDVIKNKELLL